MQGIRDSYDVMVRKAPTVTLLPAVTASLKREGTALYDRAAELADKTAGAPKLPVFLSELANKAAGAPKLPVFLLLAGIWWLETRGRHSEGW
jgi:hypothetical protein